MTGYLGPIGTFSHIAAEKFCRGERLSEYPTIHSAIMAVEYGEIDACIVPVENSIEGSVNTTLDTLVFETELYITGEYILRIKQNLIAKPGVSAEKITAVVSHPQAIGQCSRLLNREFKNVKISLAESTAAAAESVKASDGEVAMIGSESCAELNGLDILIPDCGDNRNNSTRFIRLGKNKSTKISNADKSSIAFTLENRFGTLYEALSVFEKYKINMTKIESRPAKTMLGQYMFFIDVDGNIDDANIYFALEAIRKKTTYFRFLGSYERYKQ